MDDKTQGENEALKAMFQTDGWAVLKRNTQSQLDHFREGFPFNVNDEKQLFFVRGMVATLTALLSLEEQLEAAEQAADAEDEYADPV